MEIKPTYNEDSNAQINPNSLLEFEDEAYEHPTSADLKALKARTGWNNNDIAKKVGVHYSASKGSTTVRKWLTDSEKEQRPIPYAAWRLLLIIGKVVCV